MCTPFVGVAIRNSDLSADRGQVQFVKDILGLANTQASGKRWLTVGFDDKSHAYHSAPDPNLSQDHLEQILAIYTEPMVEIRYDSIEHYEGPVGRIQVLRDSAKLPYEVAKSVGDHKRINKGQIFVHRLKSQPLEN